MSFYKKARRYRIRTQKRVFGAIKNRYAPSGRLNVRRIAKDVAYVKSVLNVERKYLDVTSTGFNTLGGAAWTVIRLNGVPPGSTLNQRDGNQIRMKTLNIIGRIKRSDTALSTVKQERVRMVLFMDKEPLTAGLGSNPAQLDLYNSLSIDSLKAWSGIQEKRFKVLLDRTYKVDQDDGEMIFKVYKKLYGRTTWPPSSTLGTEINQNALYVAFFSDTPSAVATERPLVSYQSRLTYVDN